MDYKGMTTDELKAEYRRQHELAAGRKVFQEALKVMLNSLYGASGNIWFRYFDLRIAEAITFTGEAVNRAIEREVNGYLNSVVGTEGEDFCIAMDTDSVYFRFDKLVLRAFGVPDDSGLDPAKVVEFLDQAAKFIEERVIRPCFERIAAHLGCREKVLEMKREAIASSGFWTAKKRYALDVWDMEGVRYAAPELKAVGLELVRSSTPEFCRDALSEAVKVILRGTDPDRVADLVERTWSGFERLPVEEICPSQQVKILDKHFSEGPDGTRYPRKGAPPGSRAALLYNLLLHRKGLAQRYETIGNGDQIRKVSLLMPNPIGQDIMGFPVRLPPEFGLLPWVDRRAHFEKNFLSPLRDICQEVGVRTERRSEGLLALC